MGSTALANPPSVLEYVILQSTHTVHLIILTEVNIKQDSVGMFNLPDYTLHSHLRTNQKGGGVLLYVHNSVQFSRYNINTREFECISGQVKSNNGYTIGLCAVYRPPSTNKDNFIKELQSLISTYPVKNNYIVMGDINLNIKHSNNAINYYLTSLSDLGFQCGINQFTRVEKCGKHICKSCLDHIFIRNHSNSTIYTSLINIALADHRITGCAIEGAWGSNESRANQLITKLDNKKLHSELCDIDWSEPLKYSNPNDIANYVHTKFSSAYEKCKYTVKNSSKRKECKWANQRLKNMCQKRDELYKIWLSDENNSKNRLLYNKYRNKTNKYAQYVRNKQIKTDVCRNFKNPREVWQIVNNLTGKIMNCIENILMKYFDIDPIILCNNFSKEFEQNVKNISNYCNEPLINPTTYEITPEISIRVGQAREEEIERIIKIFTKKLSRGGIQGPLLELLKNYHTNRYTTVKKADKTSNLVLTTQGTAQGSIVGPTEYLLYVNDMSNIIKKGSVYQFADDTCLLVAHKDIVEAQNLLQKNFDLLCKWAHDVGLVLNAQKTKYIHIHSSHNKVTTKPTIVAHNHLCQHSVVTSQCSCAPIELVKTHTYVGLVIDDRLSWGPHKDHVRNKLRSVLSKLAILKYKLPYKTLRLIYLALADSVIGYGLSSYGRTNKSCLEDIYDLQIRLLKTIVPKHIKNKYKDNYHQLFNHCKIMSVYDKIKLTILTEVNQPDLLNEKERNSRLRTLSENHRYLLPKIVNKYGSRKLDYVIPTYLNELPLEIQNIWDADDLHQVLQTFDDYVPIKAARHAEQILLQSHYRISYSLNGMLVICIRYLLQILDNHVTAGAARHAEQLLQ
ncbi:reverse transcriptase (RNA-dependent DNA polymerase) domain-containing protein [Phthorimaea operculella]|nr:reverse transcriptase (RNA-dependent DNA polymerase) domain-containing protein [Phthorimaea operculella]